MDLNTIITSVGLLGIFTILFVESGLLFGFFLPGDSLLITAGIIAANGQYFGIAPLIVVCVVAAISGDSVGYSIGTKTGGRIKKNQNNFIVKMGYLAEAETFYKKHGGKTVILARFVPAVRSFVPMVAGMSDMHYKDFIKYNVFGGIIWGAGLPLLGYYFGRLDFVQHNFEKFIIGVILLSLIPAAWHLAGSKEKRKKLKGGLILAKQSYKSHRTAKKVSKKSATK